MKISHYAITILLIIGLLYVYHNFVANPGTRKSFFSGLGINR